MSHVVDVLVAVVGGWLFIMAFFLVLFPILTVTSGDGFKDGFRAWNEFRRDSSPFGLAFWKGQAQ